MPFNHYPFKLRHAFWLAVFLLFSMATIAQSGDIDFTNLSGPGVTCYYGKYDNPFANVGISNGRHTIVSHQGYDSNTNNQLPYLPPGETKVVQLGDKYPGGNAEAIEYVFTVDYFKSILLLKFAVVFEDPSHEPYEQPRFVVRVLNEQGSLVEECAEYDVTAAGSIPGFNSVGMVRWRPWTNVGIDLSSYIGKKVRVQFVTYDCLFSAHFGYAYFTAKCIENHLSIASCESQTIKLKAPDDFVSYHWDNGDTSQESEYFVSDISRDASCVITSATGCQFTLHAHITVETGLPTEDIVIYDTICIGDSYQDNYFNIPPQNQMGNYIFLNTLFDLNNCVGEADLVLLLHVTDEQPAFSDEIEGIQNVHVATNIFPGEYTYRINKIPRVKDYVWSLSNPNWSLYPNQNECRVIVKTHESAILTVRAKNSCGNDERSITLNANFYDVDESSDQAPHAYPNPASNLLTVEGLNIQRLIITNIIGQELIVHNGCGRDKIVLDTSGLDNGIYILSIEYSHFKTQQQIAISR